ncbi:MAG: HAD-IA family hydrolase [Armatimonadota bacterium]
MQKLPLKAVLFDLDGTLLDSVSIIMRASERVLNDMNIEFVPEQIRSRIGIPLHVQAVDLAKDRSEEFIERYRHIYRAYQGENQVMFADTEKMLEELKKRGYILGVVTSKVAVSAKRSLVALGICDYFDIIISADDVDNPKPHPEPLIKALEILGLENNEAVYVGDSYFDIDCAKSANVTFIGVDWGARSFEELISYDADYVIKTWNEMLSIFDSMKIEPEDLNIKSVSS